MWEHDPPLPAADYRIEHLAVRWQVCQRIDEPGVGSVDTRFDLQTARGRLDPDDTRDGGQRLHGALEDLQMEFLGSGLRSHQARHLLKQIVDLLQRDFSGLARRLSRRLARTSPVRARLGWDTGGFR